MSLVMSTVKAFENQPILVVSECVVVVDVMIDGVMEGNSTSINPPHFTPYIIRSQLLKYFF